MSRYILAATFAALLGSCSGPLGTKDDRAFDLADVANANARTALSQNEEQGSEIAEQDSEIEALQAKVRDLEAQLASASDALAENTKVANANAELIDLRWEAYRAHTH